MKRRGKHWAVAGLGSLSLAVLFMGAGVRALAQPENASENTSENAIASPIALEKIAELTVAPGNIAVNPDGRIFMSLHQAYQPEFNVVELLSDGSVVPFPNSAWNNPPGIDGIGMNSVLGIQADRQGIVWMLDNAAGVSAEEGGVPRVIGWNTASDQLEKVIPIPSPVARPGSFINDLAVDNVRNTLYLADIVSDQGPAIIVVDVETGRSRRVLIGHPSLQPEADAPIVIDGQETQLAGPEGTAIEHRMGLNPITIDPAAEWVYYGSMNGTSVWRVRADDLINAALSDEALATRVARYGDKPVSDGISIDVSGNVYITDLNQKAIGITQPDGTYEVLVQDDRLLWPDSLSTGADGYMYVVVNKLHLSPLLNAGENESEPPYYVMRFQAPADLVVGR
ncbi:MAG: L-dopachrome tautomerase-related protein [Phormidesmis sp.]